MQVESREVQRGGLVGAVVGPLRKCLFSGLRQQRQLHERLIGLRNPAVSAGKQRPQHQFGTDEAVAARAVSQIDNRHAASSSRLQQFRSDDRTAPRNLTRLATPPHDARLQVVSAHGHRLDHEGQVLKESRQVQRPAARDAPDRTAVVEINGMQFIGLGRREYRQLICGDTGHFAPLVPPRIGHGSGPHSVDGSRGLIVLLDRITTGPGHASRDGIDRDQRAARRGTKQTAIGE